MRGTTPLELCDPRQRDAVRASAARVSEFLEHDASGQPRDCERDQRSHQCLGYATARHERAERCDEHGEPADEQGADAEQGMSDGSRVRRAAQSGSVCVSPIPPGCTHSPPRDSDRHSALRPDVGPAHLYQTEFHRRAVSTTRQLPAHADALMRKSLTAARVRVR